MYNIIYKIDLFLINLIYYIIIDYSKHIIILMKEKYKSNNNYNYHGH